MKLDDPIAAVIPHGFSAAEIEWNESHYRILTSEGAETLCTVCTREYIANLEGGSRAALLEQVIIAQGWHQARGRYELAAKLRSAAAMTEQIIAEEKRKLN